MKRPRVKSDDPVADQLFAAAVIALELTTDSSVLCLLMVDSNHRPYLIPSPHFDYEDTRKTLEAFAHDRWNGSESL